VSIAAAAALMSLAACKPTPEEALTEQWALLDHYCTDCHNDAERAGELTLEHASLADIAKRPEVWEKVAKRLRGGEMPPPGSVHPGVDEAKLFAVALEGSLDAADEARGPRPGHVPLHRMN